MSICLSNLARILAFALLCITWKSVDAFSYPVTTQLAIAGDGSRFSVEVTTSFQDVHTVPDQTFVPKGYIMQPASWVANSPSNVWAVTPVNDCSWYCIRSNGEAISAFARRWRSMSWVSSEVAPHFPGDMICSGIIIRGDEGTGLVSQLFFVPPQTSTSCAMSTARCTLDHGMLTLAHGSISDSQAQGHSASAILKITCSTYISGKVTLRSGADSERIALDNGGKSRLYVANQAMGSKLPLQQGLNTIELTDKLEIDNGTKLGPFRGSAVLVLDMY